MVTTTGTRGAGLKCINDSITPQLQFISANVKKSIEACEKKLNRDLRTIVLKAWERGQHEWAPLSPFTIASKGHAGKLLDTGMLYADINRANYEAVKVQRTGYDGILVEIDLSKQFISSSYIAFHELGANIFPFGNKKRLVRMPARQIFTHPATKEEFRQKIQELGGPGLIAAKALRGEPGFKAQGWMREKPMVGYLPEFIFYLPLGFLFKYMGMYSDIIGVFGADLLQPEMFSMYLRAYFMGRAKLPTKKRMRRMIRREMWRG